MPHADIEEGRACRRAYQRTPEGMAAHVRAVRAWRQRNKKRLAAHNAVSKALLRGHMVKWPACALPTCDCSEVEAHHPDYDCPLDVVWLCGPHHKQAHAEAK